MYNLLWLQIINIVTRNVAIAPANSVHSQQKRLEEKLELEKQRNSERLHRKDHPVVHCLPSDRFFLQLL